MLEIVEMVVCKSWAVKMKVYHGCIYHFEKNSEHFALKIELLLTVLSNFEREGALEDSTF